MVLVPNSKQKWISSAVNNTADVTSGGEGAPVMKLNQFTQIHPNTIMSDKGPRYGVTSGQHQGEDIGWKPKGS